MLISTHTQINVMEDGKLSLDLLIGLSIFLFTFIFIANFLPGVFADVRNEITLAHETYKVSVFLAETRGTWKNLTHNGTDWEKYHGICSDHNFIFLPSLSKGEPDYLSFEKIRAFNNSCNQCVDKCRKMFGLDVSNTRFHVSLESLYSKPYDRTLVHYYGSPLLDAGDPLPQGGNVIRFERFVWLDPIPGLTGTVLIQCQKGSYPTPVCEATTPGGQDVDCKFNFTYPFTVFTVKVNQKFHEQNAKVSICVELEDRSGACAIGQGDKISVRVDNGTNPSPEEEKQIVIGEVFDFLDFVNSSLSSLEEGDRVYVRISVRQVDVDINMRDKFMADYMAGKAVAKLVVYGW